MVPCSLWIPRVVEHSGWNQPWQVIRRGSQQTIRPLAPRIHLATCTKRVRYFQEPLLGWATTSACASGSCSGVLQNNTAGSLIQDLGLDCSVDDSGPGSVVPGCAPFWDEYGQERSELKRIRITNFNGLGIGIYTSNAQNGGPFEDLQMAFASVAPGYACIEVGGTGVGGAGPMRGVRGLTCTGPASVSSVAGTGVDINARNFSLSDAHFENVTYGVNIGSLSPAAGIQVDGITGGGGSSAIAVSTSNVTFYVQATESGYTEDVGIYNSIGTLVAHVGGTSGLFNAMGAKTVSWTTSPGSFLPGKYWFAVISTCTSSCGKMGGNATATFQSCGTYSSSGGTLPSFVTLPADSWTIGSVPTFGID